MMTESTSERDGSQRAKKLFDEIMDIRRRLTLASNPRYRAQLTRRYRQVELELESLSTDRVTIVVQAPAPSQAAHDLIGRGSREMVDRVSTLSMHSRIDGLNEEAKRIRERYAVASGQERLDLEARYSELEQELKSIKAKLSEASSLVPSRSSTGIGTVGSGPFGISMGMRIDDLEAKSESIGHGKYRLSTVPKPHSAFESYIIQSSPHCGISWVKGIGKTTSTSRYGTELRILFDEMKSRLEKVYGSRNDITDRLMPDSIWNEMGDWMVALQKRERHLSVLWGDASGAVLPNDLEHVFLYATALDDESGYIAIEYAFVNSSACEEELAALEDDVL